MTAPLKLPAEIEAAIESYGTAVDNVWRLGSRHEVDAARDVAAAHLALRSAVLKYGDERYDRGNRDGMGLV